MSEHHYRAQNLRVNSVADVQVAHARVTAPHSYAGCACWLELSQLAVRSKILGESMALKTSRRFSCWFVYLQMMLPSTQVAHKQHLLASSPWTAMLPSLLTTLLAWMNKLATAAQHTMSLALVLMQQQSQPAAGHNGRQHGCTATTGCSCHMTCAVHAIRRLKSALRVLTGPHVHSNVCHTLVFPASFSTASHAFHTCPTTALSAVKLHSSAASGRYSAS